MLTCKDVRILSYPKGLDVDAIQLFINMKVSSIYWCSKYVYLNQYILIYYVVFCNFYNVLKCELLVKVTE